MLYIHIHYDFGRHEQMMLMFTYIHVHVQCVRDCTEVVQCFVVYAMNMIGSLVSILVPAKGPNSQQVIKYQLRSDFWESYSWWRHNTVAVWTCTTLYKHFITWYSKLISICEALPVPFSVLGLKKLINTCYIDWSMYCDQKLMCSCKHFCIVFKN